MAEPRTVVFCSEGAFGPTNNCVGIGAVLRARGHRVVFIVEESFAGTLETTGLPTCLFEPAEMIAAIDRLLADRLLQVRLATTAG